MDGISPCDKLLQAVAAPSVESMALETAAATKQPGNMWTAADSTEIARADQPESGGSGVVSLLFIEPMWLGNVYNGQ